MRKPRYTCSIICHYCKRKFWAARANAKFCSKSHRVLYSIYRLRDLENKP